MNRTRVFLPAAAMVLLFLFGYAAYGPRAAEERQAQAAAKWEYKTVYLRWGRAEKGFRTESMERIEEIMNDLGGKGWELSGTVGDIAGDTDKSLRTTTSTNLILLFKRPKT